LRVCPQDDFGPGCQYQVLANALADAWPGDTIVLAAGIYEQAARVDVDNITIRGEPGAHLIGQATDGKAALVINGDNVVVDGIECSGISVADRNGACIRIQAPNLIVRNVYFHDNEEGILGGVIGGNIVIENSVFERNGWGGLAHGVYTSSRVDELIFKGNVILSTKGRGHGLKRRASRSFIEDNVIAGLDSKDSRAIDIPLGGEVVIRNNILEKGPNSDNRDMIYIANDNKQDAWHPVHSTLIENNLIIFDGPDGIFRGVMVNGSSPGPVTVSNNTIVSDATDTVAIANTSVVDLIDDGTNVFFDSREEAVLLLAKYIWFYMGAASNSCAVIHLQWIRPPTLRKDPYNAQPFARTRTTLTGPEARFSPNSRPGGLAGARPRDPRPQDSRIRNPWTTDLAILRRRPPFRMACLRCRRTGPIFSRPS
jgi:hypothetical protein